MKVFELFESSEWENTAFENKKAEMAALRKKQKSIQERLLLIGEALPPMVDSNQLIFKQTFIDMLPNSKDDYIPLTWTGASGMTRDVGSLYNYYIRKGSPQIPIVEKLGRQYLILKKLGAEVAERIKDLTVRGYSFCFTGFRDEEAERKIKSLGGSVHSSAIQGLTYLVAKTTHTMSTKMLKARQEGAKIISKNQLDDMLRD